MVGTGPERIVRPIAARRIGGRCWRLELTGTVRGPMVGVVGWMRDPPNGGGRAFAGALDGPLVCQRTRSKRARYRPRLPQLRLNATEPYRDGKAMLFTRSSSSREWVLCQQLHMDVHSV